MFGAALLLLLFPLLPESPHWLAVSGDTAAAEALLHRIARVNGVAMLPGRLEAATTAQPAQIYGCAPGVVTTPNSCRLSRRSSMHGTPSIEVKPTWESIEVKPTWLSIGLRTT